MFLFVQQKTSSEMRISDWSSDVCSSDLLDIARRFDRGLAAAERRRLYHHRRFLDGYGEPALGDSGGADAHRAVDDDGAGAGVDDHPRSEEHTSELQSLMRISYAVFCLKKKKKQKHKQHI